MSTMTEPLPTTKEVGAPGPLSMLRGLALDVGLPVLAYYVLHLLGASDWAALLAGSGLAAARIGWSAVRAGQLNAFATVMLLVYGAASRWPSRRVTRGRCCCAAR